MSELLGPRGDADLEVLPARPVGQLAAPTSPVRIPVDRCAVASAVCGLTAIVPVISQVAGLVLGVMALRRIRRARREGLRVGGVGWAVTGILSSGGVLLCWIFIFVVFGVVMSIFTRTSSALQQALSAPPR